MKTIYVILKELSSEFAFDGVTLEESISKSINVSVEIEFNERDDLYVITLNRNWHHSVYKETSEMFNDKYNISSLIYQFYREYKLNQLLNDD
jgi:hypothetical protein